MIFESDDDQNRANGAERLTAAFNLINACTLRAT
jgi:hypothetical protein